MRTFLSHLLSEDANRFIKLGHGDYNRSYDKGYDDFDYADYSTGKEDNNFRTQQKKKRKSEKQIIEDILNRWD